MKSATDKRKQVQKTWLPLDWEVRFGLNKRLYYYSRHFQNLQILPPPESWSCIHDLSYGWELAVDGSDTSYFINHILQQTTYNDPRLVSSNSCLTSKEQQPSPQPRQFTLVRDERLGFGFIAGSEKPVIVRSVTPGGPAENKLIPSDQIVRIGDKVVATAPRDEVIDLIKKSPSSVVLTVIQPAIIPNSSFLKPSKKLLKGMNRPRVRFDQGSDDDSSKSSSGSPLLTAPGVFRVNLEDGQPRSFQYDSDTTAGDIVNILCERLEIKNCKIYSLVLAPRKPKNSSLTKTFSKFSNVIIVPPWEPIDKVVTSSNFKHHDCHLRLAFVPKDVHQLSRDDSQSFNYLYQQCVNDVVSGSVYQDDLSVEDLLRLAALHIIVLGLLQEEKIQNGSHDHPVRKSSKKQSIYPLSKINLRQIEKEHGLEKFLPPSVLNLFASNSKEYRKILQHHIKTNHTNFIINGNSTANTLKMSPPGSPSQYNDGASLDVMVQRLRLQYIKSLTHFHMYGGRYFEAVILSVVESDITLLVGHHYGVSQLINSKTKMASIFGDFPLITHVEVAPYKISATSTNVNVEFKDMAPLVISMHPQSALNLAYMISGYCQAYTNSDIMLTLPTADADAAPEYFGPHNVKPSHWSYPADVGFSSQHCDFSKSLNLSILSDEIPANVRAMFQQSKIVENNVNDSTSDEDSPAFIDEEGPSPVQTSSIDVVAAASTVSASPKSSASSVTCTSPSSGIGSMASHGDRLDRMSSVNKYETSSAEIQRSRRSDASSEEVWRELVDAKVDESNPEQFLVNQMLKEPDRWISDSDELESCAEDNPQCSEDCTSVAEAKDLHIDQTAIDTNHHNKDGCHEQYISRSEKRQDSPNDFVKEKNQTSTCKNVIETAVKELEQDTVTRKRFSSFKPSEVPITNLLPEDRRQSTSASSGVSSLKSPSSGKGLTSKEFQAKLRSESLASSAHPSVGLDEDIDDQVISSPLPVDDLARGHKSLQGKKTKHQFSLGGSLTHVSGSDNVQKSSRKKRRFNFRSLFSTRRTYSMKKSRRSNLGFKNENEPKKRWRFLSMFRTSSGKKSRFSFFKRKSHNIKTSETTSPGVSQPAYMVFESRDKDGVTNIDALKMSVSYENIPLRHKESLDDKPRPISFMTFRQVSPDEDENPELPASSASTSSPKASEKTLSSVQKDHDFNISNYESDRNSEKNESALMECRSVYTVINDSEVRDVSFEPSPHKEMIEKTSVAVRVKRKAPPPPVATSRTLAQPQLISTTEKDCSDNVESALNVMPESVAKLDEESVPGVIRSQLSTSSSLPQVEFVEEEEKRLSYPDMNVASDVFDSSSDFEAGEDRNISDDQDTDRSSTTSSTMKSFQDLTSQIFSTLNLKENYEDEDLGREKNDQEKEIRFEKEDDLSGSLTMTSVSPTKSASNVINLEDNKHNSNSSISEHSVQSTSDEESENDTLQAVKKDFIKKQRDCPNDDEIVVKEHVNQSINRIEKDKIGEDITELDTNQLIVNEDFKVNDINDRIFTGDETSKQRAEKHIIVHACLAHQQALLKDPKQQSVLLTNNDPSSPANDIEEDFVTEKKNETNSSAVDKLEFNQREVKIIETSDVSSGGLLLENQINNTPIFDGDNSKENHAVQENCNEVNLQIHKKSFKEKLKEVSSYSASGSSEEEDIEKINGDKKLDSIANVLNRLLLNGLDTANYEDHSKQLRSHYITDNNEKVTDAPWSVDDSTGNQLVLNHHDEAIKDESSINFIKNNTDTSYDANGFISALPVETELESQDPNHNVNYKPKVGVSKGSQSDDMRMNSVASSYQIKINRPISDKKDNLLSNDGSVTDPIFRDKLPSESLCSDQKETSMRPRSDVYHNLIAPRLFGQKWEKKAFSRIKPPTSTAKDESSPRPKSMISMLPPPINIHQNVPLRNSTPSWLVARRSVVSHVDYPHSSKNGRPIVPPKPEVLKQKS